MKRSMMFAAVVALAVVSVGCGGIEQGLAPGAGTSRAMGDVSYQQAFAAGRQVMGQYFPLDAAKTDAARGTIHSRPKTVQAGNERILGGTPARQLAEMRITQQSGVVSAQVLVRQQRQGSSVSRHMGYSRERDPAQYTGNPGDVSPAQLDAATTADQNENWQDEKPRHDIEAAILNDLYQALHGGK
jgi:hypothetical protein